MKRLLTVLCAILIAGSAVAATAIACNNNSNNAAGATSGWHGSSRAVHLTAWLTAPTGATGATGATGSAGSTRATGATGSTAPMGVAEALQNKSFLKLKIWLRGLTPGAVYNVGLLQDADGQGCASTTNTVLDPPGSNAITANSAGIGRAKLVSQTSVFALDLTKLYYLNVTDATGAVVACGSLVNSNHHRGHGHGIGWGHGGGPGHAHH